MNKRFVAATTMMAMFVTSAAAATAYQKSITANYGISLEINGNKANLTDVNRSPTTAQLMFPFVQ